MRRLWILIFSVFISFLRASSDETDSEATNGDSPTEHPSLSPTVKLYDPVLYGGCWRTRFWIVDTIIPQGASLTLCSEKCALVGPECQTYLLDASGDDYTCKLYLSERDAWLALPGDQNNLVWSSPVDTNLDNSEDFRVIPVNRTISFINGTLQCAVNLQTLNYCGQGGGTVIEADMRGADIHTGDYLDCIVAPIIDNPDPMSCDVRIFGAIHLELFELYTYVGLELQVPSPSGTDECYEAQFRGYQNSYRCIGEDGQIPMQYHGSAASIGACRDVCITMCQAYEYHPADELCILYVIQAYPSGEGNYVEQPGGVSGLSWKQLRRIPNYDHYNSECVIREISEAPSQAPSFLPSGAPSKVFGRCMAEVGGDIVIPSHLQKLEISENECSDMCYNENADENVVGNCVAYEFNPRSGELNFETKSRCRVYIKNGMEMQVGSLTPTTWALIVDHDNVQEEKIIEVYIEDEPDNNCVVHIPEPKTEYVYIEEECIIEAPEMVMNCLNTENNQKAPEIPVSSENLAFSVVTEPIIPNLARSSFPYYANCASDENCDKWSTNQKLKYRNCSDWAGVMAERMGYEDPDNEINYKCGYAQAYINECQDLYDDCGQRRLDLMGGGSATYATLIDPLNNFYDPCIPAPYNLDYTWWMLRCPMTCGVCCNSDADCYNEQSVYHSYKRLVNEYWLAGLGTDEWEPEWTCTDQKVCEMTCESLDMPETEIPITIITDFLCNEQGDRCTSRQNGRFYECTTTYTIADDSDPCPGVCKLLGSEEFDPASCTENKENCWACPQCRAEPATFPLIRYAGWCRREEDCPKRFKGIEGYEYQATNGCVKQYTKSLIEHNYVWDCCCDSAIILGDPAAEDANITGFHPSDSLEEVLSSDALSLGIIISFILTSCFIS